MRNLLILSILIFGVSCTVDNQSQYSYDTEQYDANTNITLLPSEDMYISFERIVQLHEDMKACLGQSYSGKTVVMFRSFEDSDNWFTRDTGGVIAGLGGGWGFHWGTTKDGNKISYVFVNTDLNKAPYIYQGFDRDEYTDTQTVKHEFIHSIYYFNGVSTSDHGVDDFTNCDAWVNTYN